MNNPLSARKILEQMTFKEGCVLGPMELQLLIEWLSSIQKKIDHLEEWEGYLKTRQYILQDDIEKLKARRRWWNF